MNVRPLTQNDLISAEVARCICFNVNVDFTKRRQEILNGEESVAGRWGIFDDNNNLMGSLINHPFRIWYDGNPVPCGGIGGVTTLPEYRSNGTMRQLLTGVLKNAYESGEVFSILAPFSYDFYRKFGYETASWIVDYEISCELLQQYKHYGWCKRIDCREEEALSQMVQLIDRFSQKQNMSVVRDLDFMKSRWLNKTDEEFLNKHQYTYLLGDTDQASAYVMYCYEGAEKMRVKDLAYDGPKGLTMLLGFLGRLSAEYKTILLSLPKDVVLGILLPDPKQLKAQITHYKMMRIVNVKKALKLATKAPGTKFVLRIYDDLLLENNGCFLVTEADVQETECEPDMSVDIRALSPMLIGALPFQSSLYRKDVTLHCENKSLKEFFIDKSIFHTEHF